MSNVWPRSRKNCCSCRLLRGWVHPCWKRTFFSVVHNGLIKSAYVIVQYKVVILLEQTCNNRNYGVHGRSKSAWRWIPGFLVLVRFDVYLIYYTTYEICSKCTGLTADSTIWISCVKFGLQIVTVCDIHKKVMTVPPIIQQKLSVESKLFWKVIDNWESCCQIIKELLTARMKQVCLQWWESTCIKTHAVNDI
jgi:hypothetical protein